MEICGNVSREVTNTIDKLECGVANNTVADALEVFGTLRRLQEYVEPLGFEAHPFLVGWYNAVVEEPFRLSYPAETVAFVLVSTPSMFEKTFLPYLLKTELGDLRDPIDQCMIQCFRNLTKRFGANLIDVLHDFEMTPNRRPKILVQTAAHVAGAAYLYHMKNILSVESFSSKKLMGLCLHPKYGGWFAIRGCLIFKGFRCPTLPQRCPVNVLDLSDQQIEAINLFNFHWRDSRFRDVIPVTEKYSEIQQRYFNTPPGQRKEILEEIRTLLKLNLVSV